MAVRHYITFSACLRLLNIELICTMNGRVGSGVIKGAYARS